MHKKTFTYLVTVDVDLDAWAAEYEGSMGEDTPEIDALKHLPVLLVASVAHLEAAHAVTSISANHLKGTS